MGKKSGGTQGFRYYLSMLSGLCRGPINEVVSIRVGDEAAWDGHACGPDPQYINAPDLFGGDDKEGGIQGPFAVFMGERDQILPGAQAMPPQTGGIAGIIIDVVLKRSLRLPDIKQAIGGRVSEFRGVATLLFDGMVAAMNPYLKEWKFRVRRSTAGWFNEVAWYPAKATIYLGGTSLTVDVNRPADMVVTEDDTDGSVTITWQRNAIEGDVVTINGQTVTFVKEDPATYELPYAKTAAKSMRALANFINSKSTAYKATATYTISSVTIKVDRAASQIYAMNGSHIIYECYTNPQWGRGYPTQDIDEPTFIAAANTLCSESFGICLAWYRKEDIDVFIQKICNLIGATTYTDRETGLMVLKLIRNDYDIDDLPLFTPSTGLLSIDDDDSGSGDDAPNEIIGTSVDPISNLQIQVRAHNPAAYQAQQAPNSIDQDYKGIPTKELLSRVTLRDLRAGASGLKKYAITLDRRGWRVSPGSVIRVSDPTRGIDNLVLRVVEIDDGNMVNGAIRIKGAIDVYGLPATSYRGVIGNDWVGPSKVAVPASEELLTEASYRDVYRRLGQADAEVAEPTNAYMGQLAKAPNETSLQYDLATKAEGEADYVVRNQGAFTGTAYLSFDYDPLDTEWQLNNLSTFDSSNVGQALLCGDEIVVLEALDEATRIATVARGAGDTIPQRHEAGDLVWTIDDDLVSDGQVWLAGETINSKVLTRTAVQLLDPSLADELEVTLVGRHAKPYPPADVQVGGLTIFGFTGEQPEPLLTWAERNRLTQADDLIGHMEGTVAPEVGTTYNVRIYSPEEGGALIREETGIVGTTWTYDAAMIGADAPPSTVRVELESERDGIVSYQHYSFNVALHAGWGYNWGYNWGGN